MILMRCAVCLFMILFISCKEAEKYEKSETVEPKWAGQYILTDTEEPSRLQSLRYILSPDGSAEQHILRKSSRWADFRLEQILRGQWSSREQAILIRLQDGDRIITETYDSIAIRMDPRDSTLVDTLWVDKGKPGKSLKRIASF